MTPYRPYRRPHGRGGPGTGGTTLPLLASRLRVCELPPPGSFESLPRETPGSTSLCHEPVRIGKASPALGRSELAERWVPAFTGEAIKDVMFRFFSRALV